MLVSNERSISKAGERKGSERERKRIWELVPIQMKKARCEITWATETFGYQNFNLLKMTMPGIEWQ